jgi:hypothetical protein
MVKVLIYNILWTGLNKNKVNCIIIKPLIKYCSYWFFQ